MKYGRFIGIIVCVLFIAAIAPSVRANPVNPLDYHEWKLQEFDLANLGFYILTIFSINLIFNTLILLIPLVVLSIAKKDKPVEPIWLVEVPLLSIVGAFIDASVFRTETITLIIGIILVGLSYFIIVTLFMQCKIKSGVIVAIFAGIVNFFCWQITSISMLFVLALILIGCFYFIAVVFYMGHLTKEYFWGFPGEKYERAVSGYNRSVISVLCFFVLFVYAITLTAP